MLKTEFQLLKEFSTIISQPLRIIIEGEAGSGKTHLAQQLAKELGVYTEVWSASHKGMFTPSSQQNYSIIPDAPVYKSEHFCSTANLSRVWQERVEFWQKNNVSSKCLIIDECPNLRSLSPNNFLTRYLCLRLSQRNTNIILTTCSSISDVSASSEVWSLEQINAYTNETKVRPSFSLENIKYSLKKNYRKLLLNNFRRRYVVVRLGDRARKYAEIVLDNRSLVWQIKCSKYPCLIGNKVIDLTYAYANLG